MKKRMLTLAMTLIMALSLVVPAGAANLVDNDQGLTEENIAHVESIFCHDRIVEVQDLDGNNVTEAFIEENRSDYENGSYGNILDALANESLVIVEPFEGTDIAPQALLLGAAYSPVYTVYFKDIGSSTNTKEYIKFHLIGTYTIESISRTITSANSIDLIVDGKSGTSLDKKVRIDRNSYKISADKKSVTYNCQCTAILVVSPYLLSTMVKHISFTGRV